jgi:hypothetical protein
MILDRPDFSKQAGPSPSISRKPVLEPHIRCRRATRLTLGPLQDGDIRDFFGCASNKAPYSYQPSDAFRSDSNCGMSWPNQTSALLCSDSALIRWIVRAKPMES